MREADTKRVYEAVMAMKPFAKIAEELKLHPEAVRRHSEHCRFRSVRLTPREITMLKDHRQIYVVTYEDHARTIG